MRVQFWGVRGSIPTPLSPAEIEAKVIAMAEDVVRSGVHDPEQVATYLRGHHSKFVRSTVGGNTTCVSADWPGGTVIFDAGTGIRPFGLELMDTHFGKGGGTIHLLMSHTHWDHIMGFPYFAPLFQRNTIHIYGVHPNLEERFRGQQKPEYFPVPLDIYPAKLVFHQIEADKWYNLPDEGRFRAHKLSHPGDCYGYRLEHNNAAMVFATDSEYKQKDTSYIDNAIDFFQDADLLIFDSQYTLEESLMKEDWGHSTAVVGVDIAVRANVKTLALFHHEPNYSDAFIRDLNQKACRYHDINYPDNNLEIIVSMEGLTMKL